MLLIAVCIQTLSSDIIVFLTFLPIRWSYSYLTAGMRRQAGSCLMMTPSGTPRKLVIQCLNLAKTYFYISVMVTGVFILGV